MQPSTMRHAEPGPSPGGGLRLLAVGLALGLAASPAFARKDGLSLSACENVLGDHKIATLTAASEFADGTQTVSITGECLYARDDLLVVTIGHLALYESASDLGTSWTATGCQIQETLPPGSWMATCTLGEQLAAGSYTVCARYEGHKPRDYACTNLTVGAVGPQGPQGPQGEPGLAGMDGAPGIQGIPGAPGPPGADGTNGTNGINGQEGVDGKDGAAATVAVGTVTTGPAGGQAAVTNTGTATSISSLGISDALRMRGLASMRS